MKNSAFPFGSSPEITIQLAGGLGNQLFQYAFGRHLAVCNDAKLFLDCTGYGTNLPDPMMGVRVCGLQHFHVKAEFISSIASNEHKTLSQRFMRKIGSLFEPYKPYYQKQHIVEPTANLFVFDPRVYDRKILRSAKIFGYWQSEKYFADIKDIIRDEIVVREELRADNAEIAHEIQTTNSVAVHVRHGDNANSIARELGVLPIEYYRKSIGSIMKEIPTPHLYVFSDDLPWAKKELRFDLPITFVGHNGAFADFEDLRLMSLCKHHVIANSTFSWWGAWLAKKENQIVYAPRRFYQNIDLPNPDLYPQGWRTI